jgi:hypothetical protein
LRLLLDIDADGYQLTRLPVEPAVTDERGVSRIRYATDGEVATDLRLGLLCSGRAFGGLLAMLSTQISEATGQDVTLVAEEVKH